MGFVAGFAPVFWLWLLIKQVAGRIAKRSGPLFKQLLPAVEIELTDPLRFILGAVMIMRYERFDPVAVMRLVDAIWVAVLAGVLPILGAVLWTGVDPVVYAITVFVMGLVALVPRGLMIYVARVGYRTTAIPRAGKLQSASPSASPSSSGFS